jgi:putative hemolysin
MFFEIGIVVALIALNGLFAMSEIAIVSSRRARIEVQAAAGHRGARAALRLLDDPSRFLATVQIGITLVGIFAGAYGGATIAGHLAAPLNEFDFIAPHGDDVAITLVVVAITYFSLIIGELVPKRIGLNNPEAIAITIAPPMEALSRVAAPAVWLLRRSTEAVIAVLGVKQAQRTTVSEEEVKSMIAEGTQAGTFTHAEQAMIESVLRLADRTVKSVMTPRRDLFWLDPNDSADVIREEMLKARYSRLLVCESTTDVVIGVVTTKDVLAAVLQDPQIDIRQLMVPPVAVPETMQLLKLIDFLRTNAVHMVVVVDERGTTQGIVTTTDILESIAGQLPQHGDDPAAILTQRDDGSWLVDGSLPVDQFEDRLGLRGLRRPDDFNTLAGLVLYSLKHLPHVGERVRANGLLLEVVDMDGQRIDKLLVTRIAQEEETG